MTPELITEVKSWNSNTCELFASRVNYNDDDSCWNWSGPVSKYNGKAFFYMPDLLVPVQETVYLLDCGPIEGGKVVPLCGNILCCNPSHLALTDEEK